MTSPPSPKPSKSPRNFRAPPPPVVKTPVVEKKPQVSEERIEHMKKMSELKTLMPETETTYYNRLVSSDNTLFNPFPNGKF